MRLFTLQLSLFFLLFFVHVEASSSWLDVLDKLDVNDINHWNFNELSPTTRPPTTTPPTKTTRRARATKVKRTRRSRSSKTTPTPTRPTTRPTTKITHRPTTRPTTKRSTTTRRTRPTTKRSTTQRPTPKRSTTQRPTTKRPTTTRRVRRTRRTRGTRGTKPRPTTKKTTTKRTTPKKATTKRVTTKKATTKRTTPKKATTKRTTPKKATAKRVTPKKATTKRVTTKRSTTKRATTPTRTIRLNTKPWKFKPIVFPGGVRQVTRKPLHTRKPHPTSPYPEFPQKSDVSIHDIVKNFKLNRATRRTAKRTAPLRDLANDREQLERNAKAEEKAKEEEIRRKIEALRRRIQQQSHLATRPGPTTQISKLSPHTHRPTTTTVITTRPTTTRPTTTRHTNIPLKQLPIAEQQRLELEHLRQRRVEAEERLAKLKQKFEADKKNHERKQIIRENPNNALHPETPRPARVEAGPQAASWPRVNPEQLKRAQEEQEKREAAIREKFKGQPPSHHYLSVLSSPVPTTRRPTGRPSKDEANLRRFLSQIKSQSPNNNDPYFLVAQKTKSHNPVVMQLSQDSWRLLKQLKSQVSSDGWLDLARHLVKFGKSEEK